MMEIPAGSDCDGTVGSGREIRYWACPFYINDEGSESCSAFDESLYGGKCDRCLSVYPNGADVEIKARLV